MKGSMSITIINQWVNERTIRLIRLRPVVFPSLGMLRAVACRDICQSRGPLQ